MLCKYRTYSISEDVATSPPVFKGLYVGNFNKIKKKK